MSNRSLGNPFDAESNLAHTASCVCAVCKSELQSGEGLSDRDRQILMERQISDQESVSHTSSSAATETFGSSEDMMDRVVENAIVRGVFGHNDASRRKASSIDSSRANERVWHSVGAAFMT